MKQIIAKLKTMKLPLRAVSGAKLLAAIAGALTLGLAMGGVAMFLSGGDSHPKPAFSSELNRSAEVMAAAKAYQDQGRLGEAEPFEIAQSIEPVADEEAIEGDQADSADTDERQQEDGASRLVSRDRLFGVDSDGPLPPAIAETSANGPRLEASPDLLEPGVDGTLPKIGPEGLRSFEAYARPETLTDRPKVAVVVLDLGLDSQLTANSVELPPQVTLGFSPYMAHGDAWHRYARGHGHETLLTLPIRQPPEKARDEGPLSLDPDWPDDDLVIALNRVLSRATGYTAVAASPGRFAARPEQFQPVARTLAARGLGLIELGQPALTAGADIEGLHSAVASIDLDRELEPSAIENQLKVLERQAEITGKAMGYTRAYPIVFDRLWHWATNLDEGRVQLVPASALLSD